MPAISTRNYSDSFGSHRLGFTDKMLNIALDIFGSHRGSFDQAGTPVIQARSVSEPSEHLEPPKPGLLDRFHPEPANWAVWQFVIFFLLVTTFVCGLGYLIEYNHTKDAERERAEQIAEFELEDVNRSYGTMRHRAGSVSGRR
ncbi:hypothetical protein FPQ18DRAFT_383647 [Pyronema domesticum]|nr:hypothetical protein FPQ18DRAFT_383647 [Pyronema domesticum]